MIETTTRCHLCCNQCVSAQGQPERFIRVLKIVEPMGGGEYEAACPKEISLNNIARMNRDQICAKVCR